MWYSVDTYQVLTQDRISEKLREAARDRRAREFAPPKARGQANRTPQGAAAGRSLFAAVRALLSRRAGGSQRMSSGRCA